MKWYWEPFHQTGLRFLEICKKNNFSEKQKENLIFNISVLRANSQIAKKAPHILDEFGRLKPLDPTERIKITTKLTEDEKIFVQKVSDFKKTSKNLEPLVEKMEEYKEIEKLWSKKPEVFKRFKALSSWDKLEVMESLFGLTKSHTTLEFQRIDETASIP